MRALREVADEPAQDVAPHRLIARRVGRVVLAHHVPAQVRREVSEGAVAGRQATAAKAHLGEAASIRLEVGNLVIFGWSAAAQARWRTAPTIAGYRTTPRVLPDLRERRDGLRHVLGRVRGARAARGCAPGPCGTTG